MRVAARTRRPGKAEDDSARVRLEPVAEEVQQLELEPRLLTHLAPKRIDRQLVLVQEAAGQIP